MKPSKSRGCAREQIVVKICKPLYCPYTQYMTSSWILKWFSINCSCTDGARFLIPKVLPVLFKNAIFTCFTISKTYFKSWILTSFSKIAQNDQWNLKIIPTDKKYDILQRLAGGHCWYQLLLIWRILTFLLNMLSLT